jgi:predicted ATPase
VVESFFLKDQINYVSPLRAYPKRFYSLDNASSSTYFDTLNGEAMVELLKANNKLKTKVNAWLKQSSLISKLKIDVKQVQSYIHKLIVEQYDIKLDITDVGFGISQVLPILVQGFISPNNTLTMMEQPEVHLHPTMQANLADLFVKIIKTNNGKKNQRSLLIETHSEYILNRLRRRIAEGKDITNEDIAIYAIERVEDNTVINSLEIPVKGNFKYPEDFYSGELFKDTMIFLKAQND